MFSHIFFLSRCARNEKQNHLPAHSGGLRRRLSAVHRGSRRGRCGGGGGRRRGRLGAPALCHAEDLGRRPGAADGPGDVLGGICRVRLELRGGRKEEDVKL